MFTKRERAIYKYHNGEKAVYGDPLQLRRAVRIAAGEDPNRLCQRAGPLHQGGEVTPEEYETAHAAEAKLAEAIVKAFGLKAFDATTGEGVTHADCIDLWNDFCSWLQKKRTNTATTPTSSPTTTSQACESATN